jgi:superfamily I DNA/RNA helicase
MKERAHETIRGVPELMGGTFHSFASKMLRITAKTWNIDSFTKYDEGTRGAKDVAVTVWGMIRQGFPKKTN